MNRSRLGGRLNLDLAPQHGLIDRVVRRAAPGVRGVRPVLSGCDRSGAQELAVRGVNVLEQDVLHLEFEIKRTSSPRLTPSMRHAMDDLDLKQA